MYEPVNDISDVSELGPEDLENIVKGVDDMDDALFGFQTKPQESQKVKKSAGVSKTTSRPTSAKKDTTNFPEGDLLADISLSDDDFFDNGKKSPATSKSKDKVPNTTLKSSEDKVLKSRKIANLFGLESDEDSVTGTKKKQEGAADWLGIKESPVKMTSKPLNTQTDKTDLIPRKSGLEVATVKTEMINDIGDLLDIKSTIDLNLKEKQTIAVESSKTELVLPKTKYVKSSSVIDLIGNDSEPVIMDQPKEKKSAIFDELFGNNELKKSSRRNSASKPEPNATDFSGVAATESTTPAVQYTPSSGVSRRPGLGRRREQNANPPSITHPPIFFQDEWINPLVQKEEKKPTTTTSSAPMPKSSAVEVHDSLPSWLGGTNIANISDSQSKSTVEKVQEKPEVEGPKHDTIPSANQENTSKTRKPEERVEEVLKLSNELGQQTTLALQRTEAQLVSALGLQRAQSSLEAVCERQRNLLDSQERQLELLVTRQLDKQTQLEKHLVAQQERIRHLLEGLAMNESSCPNNGALPPGLQNGYNESQNKLVNSLEAEVQKATLENEEFKMKIKLMEKHYKMEFESLQIQHRREIEFLEDQVVKQKEVTDQLKEDFKDRIAQMKVAEAELMAQHNERVQRLRDEWVEDMRQMMQFHTFTMEQVTSMAKLAAPYIRDEKQSPMESSKPLDDSQISEREQELIKKEKFLTTLQKKLETNKENSEKKLEEAEAKLDEEKMKIEETKRNLRQEQALLKYTQEQMSQEKKHLEEQYHSQRTQLEEMQEKILAEQTQLATEQLILAKEKAKLDALAKLQGVSGTLSFDVLQSKAEVHGALEAARSAEMEAVKEKQRLKEKERALDNQRWKLQELEEDLVARSRHMDQLLQESEAKQKASEKTMEEAKQVEKMAEGKLQEVERRKKELNEKEQGLIKLKLEIAQEEIRISRKREQLEHILPKLSDEEAFTLKPIKDVIDPKMLIMKLRAEREMDFISKQQVETSNG